MKNLNKTFVFSFIGVGILWEYVARIGGGAATSWTSVLPKLVSVTSDITLTRFFFVLFIWAALAFGITKTIEALQ